MKARIANRKLVDRAGQRRSGSAATPAWPGRSRRAPRPAAPAIRRDGVAGRVHVALELDVAAERQPADLPARAAPVGPAEHLAAEADREGLRLHAEPAADEIMAELVDEDERPDDEQEGQDREQRNSGLLKRGTFLSAATATARASRIDLQHLVDRRRRGRIVSGQHIADQCGDIEEADPPCKERCDRYLVGGVEDRRLGAALRAAPRGPAPSAGKRSRSGASKSSRPIATRSSRSHGVSIRSGQARV